MVCVILGMHKSGTTAVAKTMDNSGINFLDPRDFSEAVSYDKGNQYERLRVIDLNNGLLGSANTRSIEIVTRLDETSVPEKLSEKVRAIIEELDREHADWGLKDPRMSLSFPAWKKHLPEHSLVIVYRHPLEVWLHYQKDPATGKPKNRVVTGWKTLNAWYVYNTNILSFFQPGNPNHFILEYRRFMTGDSTLRQLSAFLGKPLSDQRNPGMYRNKDRSSWMFSLFAWLQATFFSRDVLKLYDEMEATRRTQEGLTE